MIRRLIDMQASSEIAGPSMQAYGTSEGVTKAWDTRGRGEKVAAALREHGIHEIGSRLKGVKTFTARTKEDARGKADSQFHRFDVKNDGSWRHTRMYQSSDIVNARRHGDGPASMRSYLSSGKFTTSNRTDGHRWHDIPEGRG